MTKNIWYPDQVEPEQDDLNYIDYWIQEKNRCINGFTLADGQVYISGWLYFYTVYWTIELDEEFTNPINGKKTSRKVKGTPLLRDIEWIVAGDLEEAERLKKMYTFITARGTGKSHLSSSIIGQTYTFFDDSESLISGGNHPDIAKLAEKINLGLSNITPVFQKQRLKDNWKVEVRAGWKDKATGFERGSNSRILARNYDDGNQTMATNGTRPKRQIIDEAGKIPNLIKCVLDSQPSWMNDFGFFSLPIITGTGGDMEVGVDLGTIFNNPRVYNILEFDDEWEGRGKIGRFIPVTQGRNEYKEPWSLSKYLGIQHPDLDKITILVSNIQKCMNEFVIPRRANALRSTTSNEITKEKAYYPLTPSECFLTISSNDFPVEAVKEQITWLDKNDFHPLCVELYRDVQGNVQVKDSNKKAVSDFPVKANSDKEGVIEIVERPISNPPYGLYAFGIDPYKTSESDWSDSLGAVCVIKRMTSNLTEPFQYMPVAWYTGRPKDIETWQENTRMLIEWYSGSVMCENNDYNFIQYMINHNQAPQYMAEGQTFLKEISPNSKHKSTYGLPATTQTIEHWNNSAVIYTKELYAKEYNDKGEIIGKKLGVTRILDRMLLEEMIKFNKRQGNFDRVRAFGIAIAHANQLTGLISKIEIEQEYKKPTKIIRSPFNTLKGLNPRTTSPFIGGRSRI